MDYYCRYLHFILIVYITVYKASFLSYFSVYKAFIYMMLMENFVKRHNYKSVTNMKKEEMERLERNRKR